MLWSTPRSTSAGSRRWPGFGSALKKSGCPARRASRSSRERREERPGIFLATAHPAKFAEVVEPIIGRTIPKPQPLLEALAVKRNILEIDATLDAVNKVLG